MKEEERRNTPINVKANISNGELYKKYYITISSANINATILNHLLAN